MADLLSHVLAAYALFTVVGWIVPSVSRRWVVVAMGGAAIPDLVKVDLILPADTVEMAVGMPFSFRAFSTLGGVFLVAGLIALWFDADHRRSAYLFLVSGGITSLVGDGLRVFVDGSSTAWLYPLTWLRPPSPNLYVSSDPRVLLVTLSVATVVYLLNRYLERGGETA